MKKKSRKYIELEQSSYFGGKAGEGTYHKLINQFPKHTTYVAGCLGLDAAMCYKIPAEYNIGIEINLEVAAIWSRAKFTSSDITPSNLTILNKSFFDVNLPCFQSPETLLYLDPPYTHGERKSNTRYPFEFTMEQHKQMLNKVVGFNCMVAISCYDNTLYQKILEEQNNWRKIQFDVVTRSGRMATETLYMNYPEVAPDQLHDRRFTGENSRVREVTKKRLKTIMGKIYRLEGRERGLLFDKLREAYPNQFNALFGVKDR